MTLSKDELAAEKKDLKQYEVKTGSMIADGILAKVDLDRDGLSDAAELNRFFQKHKPMVDKYSPLITALAPFLSEQGVVETLLESKMIKPGQKENARKVLGQILTVTKQLAAEAKDVAAAAKDVAEVAQAVKSVTGK